MLFNVTVSHENGSLYDARNLTVTDSTQGMDFYDSDVSTEGAFVTSPKKNTFGVRFMLASLIGKLKLTLDISTNYKGYVVVVVVLFFFFGGGGGLSFAPICAFPPL